MPEVSFDNLLIICVIAALAPRIAGALPKLRVPLSCWRSWRALSSGPTGWTGQQPLLIAIALSATSLGLVVPVLKDAGQRASAVGQIAIAGAKVVLLTAFTAMVVLTAVVGLVDRDSSSHPHLRSKLDAIGFGFVLPVFFISSGIKLDLTGLMHSPGALIRVPVFLVILLVVRGVPALLILRELGGRATLAVGLFQATSLPFLVTATQIGLVLGKISTVTAAAIVCAGLLSVLLFASIALSLLRTSQSEPDPPDRPERHVRKAASN